MKILWNMRVVGAGADKFLFLELEPIYFFGAGAD